MKQITRFRFHVWLLGVLLFLPKVSLTAPLPEKIRAQQPQRNDCVSPEEVAYDGFVAYIEEFLFTDDRAGISLYSCVNWRDGFLKSEGVGKNRSRRTAELVARNNALKTLIVLNVNADDTLQTYLERQQDVSLRIQNVLIKNADLQDVPADPENPDLAKVIVTIPFYGISGLTSFFLDNQEIYLPSHTQVPPSTSETSATEYTGIVIDASDVPLEPALFPQIVSEDGEVLYTASQVDKPVLLEQGMVEYVYASASTTAWRAGDHPLVVKPVLVASADLLLPLAAPFQSPILLAEAKSREGRGRKNALVVNASKAAGQQPVNVVVSVEDAKRMKAANARQPVNQQGNYTVIIGREIGGVQGRLYPGIYARHRP